MSGDIIIPSGTGGTLVVEIDYNGPPGANGTTGNQTISGVPLGSRNIQLRPVAESLATNPAVIASNYTMSANASDTKTVTVT